MHERFGEKDQAIACYRKALQNREYAGKDYPSSLDARQRLHKFMK